MIRDLQYYLDTFRVTPRLLEEITDLGMGNGALWCDLYFENNASFNLSLQDSIVSGCRITEDYGVGIRVLSGEKTGYAYSESTDVSSMKSAVKAASAITLGAPVKVTGRGIASGDGYVPRLYKGKPNTAADRYPVKESWRDISMEKFIPMMMKMEAMVRDREPRTAKVVVNLTHEMDDILMYNSFGELKYETRPMGTLMMNVVFSNGGEPYSFGASRSFRMGTEMFTDALTQELVDEILHNIDDRFNAIRPRGGEMNVVMGAGASGILLHEAMGHAFEADFNRKGQSIFHDSMGKKICEDNITIVDDGTLPFDRGSLNFDDEGVPSQRTEMVKDGILTSYLHDRISARHYGVSPTGNGRREDFRCSPLPRMRSTYMENGDSDPADIIASVKKGIYVDTFSNGQVKIGEGDFTFFVNSGYLIEDGHLTAPIKDINVIGNGPKALSDIVAVGNDARVDHGSWTCGKGQSVPVSCGIPTVLVSSLTVGGAQ